MALEEDLAELDTVLDDLDNMMKDINIQSVLEFFPNNNNEKFKDIIHSEMDADGPAGRLLRTLSRDGSKRSADFLTSATSTTKLIDNTSTSSSSLYQSDESNRAENSGANRISSFTSSSISYDENMVDLGSCSEGGSHTRPNSICKFKSDSSSENDVDSDDFMKCDLEHQNGNLNSKLHIIVYFQERPIDLEVPSCATAREVAFRIMIISRLQDSSHWTIFDCLKEYELERNLEDHEIVADVIKSWPNQSEHRLQLKNFSKKYEFFQKPSIYVPSYLMENEETTKTATLRADDSWKPEYNSYLTTVDRIPELENFLHLKDFRKKSWNRKYCLLRPNGIFSSSKTGLKRLSREVKCKIDFNTSELYFTSSNFKETHKSPNGYCFCFVPNSFSNQKDIKCFCAENEQVMLSWIMGYRLAKFGSKLYRNYKIATQDKRAARTVSAPVEMEGVVRRKRPSVEYRVPIDFSGRQSRVVSDPDAARAVKNSISSKLPKRIKRRSTGSLHSPYTSGIPALIEKPWFHGKLEREEAVKRLRSNGMEEGLFLVRESCTSTGVNVISVIKKKKILHHQIFKAIGEGQIFYGLEHGPRFQSLEQLIEFYQNYRNAGKSSLLRKPCKRSEKFNY